MKKAATTYFILLALIAIALMAWDSSKRPFNPNNDIIGNSKHSMIIYPLLVIAELLIAFYTVNVFTKKKMAVKIVFLALWMAGTVLGFINAMWGGGVPAAHALWLLVVSISLALLFFIGLRKQNK